MDYLTLSNGFQTDYTGLGNSGDKRLQTMQHKTAGGLNITKLDYTYDAEGRILSLSDQIDTTSGRMTTGINGANPYDAADQLTTWETRNTANNNVLASLSYSYDASGNAAPTR